MSTIDTVDFATTTSQEVVAALIRTGGCIVRNFVSQEDVQAIDKAVRPFLDADKEWDGEFFPAETRRVMGLAGKCPLYIEKIPGNPLYRAVCDELLTSRFTCWLGNKREDSISSPQLNNTVVLSIGPGARAQDLHRDDMIHHNSVPEITAEEYRVGRDTGIGLFVAGKKTTKANGATRFVPGSHLEASCTAPDDSKSVYAELEPGDAFIMLSSCYHGGSANTTKDEERLVFSCFMTKGLLRQEENQYLANPIEKIKSYPVELQKLIGYELSKPFLGWVNLQDPRQLLLAEGQTLAGKDLY